MILRPYQTEIIQQTRQLMQQGCRSILIQAPTGSGKTALTAHMLTTAASKGIRSFFCVHRKELIMQSAKAFDEIGLPFGIIASGFHEDARPLVQIVSIQTLARRINKVKRPSLVVWDESHHCPSKSYDIIYRQYSEAYHIGLTATPQRLDGTGLGKWFTRMVQGPSVAALISQGYLSPYKAYAPSQIDTSGLHIRMGDFVQAEAVAQVDRPTITGDAVSHYQRFAPGKRAIVFCASIQHSMHVVQQFLESGIPSEHVDGDTDSRTRDAAMRRFRDGETLILSNVDLFGEGLDVPSLEAVILLRPTASLGLHLQQLGRCLRPQDGKSAIILDHAGNIMRHGLPDEPREWTLEGRKRKKTDAPGEPKIRICKLCFAAIPAGQAICRCGYVFPVTPREVVEQAGELQEVDPEQLRRIRKQEQGQARGLQELIQLGKLRGYKWAWALNVIKARQGR